jgi:hypothetical protein
MRFTEDLKIVDIPEVPSVLGGNDVVYVGVPWEGHVCRAVRFDAASAVESDGLGT